MHLMNLGKERFYLQQEYLSDIELYYTTKINSNKIELNGDEFKHACKVMRHSVGDVLHITDGNGNYFETIISTISNNSILANIKKRKSYTNTFSNIYFCFPRLKSVDRFEFEIEKLVELGITNFVIFNSERTIPKGEKLERWNKIALASMKQSLRTYLPKFEYLSSLVKVNLLNGEKLILDQKGECSLISYLKEIKAKPSNISYCFIFGPEGGLSQNEMDLIKNNRILALTNNRLRAETAVIVAATTITLI